MREKLIELLRSNRTVLETAGKSATSLLRLADHLIDNGVEIPVRCKNCKKEWCYLRQELGAEGFCSAGERKD